MKFEWDEDKRLRNIKKHKIDFKDIQDIFENPIVELIDTREDYGEDRIIALGVSNLVKNHPTVLVAVYIEVIEDTIRFISARKALKHEQRKYYRKIF